MNTTFNNAGDLQGIIISKHDSNFMEAVVNAIEIIDSHPNYTAWVSTISDRIAISKRVGNNDIVSIKIPNINHINVEEEIITIVCETYAVSISFSEPTFITY